MSDQWHLGVKTDRGYMLNNENNVPVAEVFDAESAITVLRALMRISTRVHRAEEDFGRLQKSMERFVLYWWENHLPDERDREMAKMNPDNPEIVAVLESLRGKTQDE